MFRWQIILLHETVLRVLSLQLNELHDVVLYFPLWNESRETSIPRELKINYSGPVLTRIGLFLEHCSEELI